MDRLRRIHELRDAYESALDDAERLRDEYHREIVKLHRSGVSLREIADGLGVSHQRVHQIVAPIEAPTSRKPRRAAAGGAIAALALIAVIGTALLASRLISPPSDRATSSVGGATGTPDAGSRLCAVTDPLSSQSLGASLAARCGRDVFDSGAIVALDPDTGKVLAIRGVTSSETLRRALSTISACGQSDGDDVLILGMGCRQARFTPSAGRSQTGGDQGAIGENGLTSGSQVWQR